MKYQIVHKTTYSYSEPASLSQNELFLHPRETIWQRVIKSDLEIFPQPQYFNERTDYFGNIGQVFMVQHPHNELQMTTSSIVETSSPVTPVPESTFAWEKTVERLACHEQPVELDAYQYIFASPLLKLTPSVNDYAKPSFPPGTPVLAGALDLIRRIFSEFTYDKSATNVDTPLEQVLTNRKGVCQDFAHIAISCLRSLGLAARYVSGYLETLPPKGKPKLIGADASHAWISVFIPDVGWVDLDPTNNLLSGEKHITLAWGRDYGDVTPVKGVVMGGGIHTLDVRVDVAAIS